MWKRSIAYAQESAPVAQEGAPGQSISSMLMFMLMVFAVMFFLIIMPNQRREKRRKEMLASLSKGDKVTTSGGIFGTIFGLNDKTVVLKVSDDPVTKMEFVRGAVSQVAAPSDEGSDK